MDDFPLFTGNCPENVAKDAKYAVRSEGRKIVIGLTFRAPNREKWYATTEEHPKLAEMVNAVKTTKGDSRHGPFYVNEYSQVIVPVGQEATYYLAGEYTRPLRFDFEGKILSGDAVDLDGRPLKPGDTWIGPHPGIPYVLAAGGKDIKYTREVRRRVSKEILLSEAIGAEKATLMAKNIRDVKGWEGGRFYVNEWRRIFAPVARGDAWEYVYIGQLADMTSWFHKP
jgi:hypothetical protein